jgi:hypothetical protein
VKSRTLLFCFLVLLPVLLPAQTLDFNSSRSAEQLRWGVQAFHRGLYNDAWTALEKAISYQPTNTLAQVWLGRAQWKAGYEQEALRIWQHVVDSGNGSALIRDWIKVLQLRRGMGRELAGSATLVVSSELDGDSVAGYPFKRPTSVRARADGSFWVVAFGSNEILRFDPNFKLVTSFKGGLEGFNRPYDILEAADGSLFVSEYGANRITKCDSQGAKIKTFGGTGTGNGLFLGPQYLAADSRGYIWVTDWGNSRVMRFNQDGAFIQAVGGIAGPTGIAAYEDRLYVSEKQDKRILVYDLNGNFLSTVGEGTLEDPEGLAFTRAGVLLVADNNRILACDLERETWSVQGNTSAHTKRLVQQSVSPNGDVLGVDFDSSKVVLLSDVTALYSGMAVRVDRVNAAQFPTVYVDVSVENRFGRPVVGLSLVNFIVTEGRAAVGELSLALTSSSPRSIDVSMLVERSPGFEQYRADAEQAIASLYALVTQGGRIKAISAGEKPVREADFGETRLRFVREALQSNPSAKWRFDLGAKMAGDELITAVTGAKKAIVFLTSGALGPGAFSTYSVLEVAAFLRNNAVAFYPVVFGGKPPDENLAFLASQTGGKLYNVSSPEGMQGVVGDIKARVTPVYSLRYRSATPPRFGDAYIPLEIEVTAQKVSGRDESGYYAPPTTGASEK